MTDSAMFTIKVVMSGICPIKLRFSISRNTESMVVKASLDFSSNSNATQVSWSRPNNLQHLANALLKAAKLGSNVSDDFSDVILLIFSSRAIRARRISWPVVGYELAASVILLSKDGSVLRSELILIWKEISSLSALAVGSWLS